MSDLAQWPFVESAEVTDGFDVERSSGKHRAVDVAATLGSAIRAPEAGSLLLLYMPRAGQSPPGAGGQYGLPYPLDRFSWYFADRYGACVILLGARWWWLFAHVPVDSLFRIAADRGLAMHGGKWKDPADASRFIELYSNVNDQPYPSVARGVVIGHVGDSGYSTAPHCHFETMPIGYEGGAPARVDPMPLFGL